MPDKFAMKLWAMLLFISLSAQASQSATLQLRAFVPSIYRVFLNSDGTITTTHNHPGSAILPSVEREDKNGHTLITVIHP